MQISGKNVLITGAGGFIGSRLTKRLVELGVTTRAFVRYNSRNDHGMIEYLPSEIKKETEILVGDLRDPEAIRNSCKNVDVIFHLGALIAIPYSYKNFREVVDTNVMGTLNILSAAKSFNVQKIVHTSTSEVYGTAQYVPIDEKHPLQGQSPYSASKIGADKIAESFHKSFNLPVATIRPFNTYGPGQSARAVIPTIITQALSKKVIQLGALYPTRDLTFVEDTVNAFIKVAECDHSIGQVINFGSNFEISIKDLAEKIISLIGRSVQIVSSQERIRPKESEVDRLWADNSKAIKLLNWGPEVSLDEGLNKTICWIEENLKIYKTDIYNI